MSLAKQAGLHMDLENLPSVLACWPLPTYVPCYVPGKQIGFWSVISTFVVSRRWRVSWEGAEPYVYWPVPVVGAVDHASTPHSWCRYGVGNHMTLVKEPKCDSAEVTQIVQSMVHEAEQVTDVGAELSFVLPSSATAHFPELFDTLECKLWWNASICLLLLVS